MDKIPIYRDTNINKGIRTNTGKKDDSKQWHPDISENESKEWLSFIAIEERKMDDYYTSDTCRNCMKYRSEECNGEREICEDFLYSPKPPKPFQ